MPEQRIIVVAGLGPWGASTARALARSGHRVVAIDAHAPPHTWGSHTGRTRVARHSAHEGAHYGPISARAFELWNELQHTSSTTVLHRTGALLLDQPDGLLIGASRDTLQAGDWPYEELDAAAVQARWPGTTMLDGEIGLYEPEACVIDAPAAVALLLRAAGAAGAELHLRERLVTWESDGDAVTVETDTRRLRADNLVLCVGNRAPDLARVAWPLEVERQVLVGFATPTTTDPLPVVMAVDPRLGPRSGFYGSPDGPGRYKVALHHDGLTGHPDDLPTEVLDTDLDVIHEVVARRLPALPLQVLDAQTCTYTNSPDHGWILDHHADHSNVVIGTADSGRGFRYAPAVGELLAGVFDGRPVPDELRAQRFAHA